ncbi:alpha-L-glutamate ligase [Nocardia sp. SYP-A9097]|uniref:ATP-grasp domain-containing protein n=1 Tax=Nocardia sp. SYP-A9097 TaxID=2663237 RepID=UPI00129ABCEF|nr:alpha-L-glutamate ligase [Nocardia sp. SYP-A9097]MRH91487.1 alpha-L-glutamate ligase [Nocardia sp. SYP-A9097]
MRIGLLTANPGHPLLAATTSLLTADGHRIEHLAPNAVAPPSDPADIYLLKARTPAALALARALEDTGVPVLNSAAATEFCQDRAYMAQRAEEAGFPFARTTVLPNPGQLDDFERPLVVKSRHSRRGDLVTRIADAAELEVVRRRWFDEPIVVQDFTPGTGWDHKLWVIGDRVFAALRQSEFAPEPRLPDRHSSIPHPWADLALAVGEAFDLQVYGVDILEVAGSPLIVDVNAFPGMRGQSRAPQALAARVLAKPSVNTNRYECVAS